MWVLQCTLSLLFLAVLSKEFYVMARLVGQLNPSRLGPGEREKN